MTLSTLPSPANSLRVKYLQLLKDVDLQIAKVEKALAEVILQCRAGCSECCIQFGITPLEASLLAEHIDTFPGNRQKSDNMCALLSDNRCSFYSYRPIICRTQGLPIGYVDYEAQCVEVSACPLNFPEDFQFAENTILFMDQFNSRLAELNSIYCRVVGLDSQTRILLSEIAGNSLVQIRAEE